MGRKKKQDNVEWEDVTDTFSMERRHYHDSFLEICEVHNRELEVSLFTRDNPDNWEIYVGYSYMTGIVKTSADKADSLRKELKEVLLEEYKKNKRPTRDFVEMFEDKYKLEWEDPIKIDFSLEKMLKALDDISRVFKDK